MMTGGTTIVGNPRLGLVPANYEKTQKSRGVLDLFPNKFAGVPHPWEDAVEISTNHAEKTRSGSLNVNRTNRCWLQHNVSLLEFITFIICMCFLCIAAFDPHNIEIL